MFKEARVQARAFFIPFSTTSHVIDSAAMRIGFITQLLWPRYGPFWERLISGAGLEVIYAEPEEVRQKLSDERLEAVSGFAFKLAAAEALALADTDVILAPDLNAGTTSLRGSGQDPFIASFPEALDASLSGLPSIMSIPALLTDNLETLAISTLQTLTRDPALVRRVWERQRASARPSKMAEPRWRVRPSEGGTLGVIAQPWLLREEVIRASLEHLALTSHTVSQSQLDPAMLRGEGQRVDERLIPTDSEVLGAARYLGRKGSVTKLVMIADKTSGADAWLVSRVQKLVYKPLEVVYLQDVLEPDTLLKAFGS